MATTDVVAGLAPFKGIGVTSSGTGAANVTGAPGGLNAVGIEVTDGTVITGAESSTTSGRYEFADRSGTTASVVLYFIV